MGRGGTGSLWECDECGHIIMIRAPHQCYIQEEDRVISATGFWLLYEMCMSLWHPTLWCPQCRARRKIMMEQRLEFLDLYRQVVSITDVDKLSIGEYANYKARLKHSEPVCHVCNSDLKAGMDEDDVCPKCNTGRFNLTGLIII